MAFPKGTIDPLCFDEKCFMQEDFNTDRFVNNCRRRVTIDQLRCDLETYFKNLKAGMIELINSDYGDFVNLSSKLAGLDHSLSNISVPLSQLKEEICSMKIAINQILESVRNKVKERREIQQNKVFLEHLIDALDAVDSLEELISGSSPVHGKGNGAVSSTSLTRSAVEFNHLQFLVSQTQEHPLVQQLTPRISEVTQKLQNALEAVFLDSFQEKDKAQLFACLQTYAIINKQTSAESMFRNLIVKPYMERVISAKVLGNPNGLAVMFDDIITFLPAYCQTLNDVTAGNIGVSEERVTPLEGYNFLVNSVWPEIVDLLEKRLPLLFALGNPDTFHKNFTSTSKFLDRFELHCVSVAQVKLLRSSASYTAFLSKWTLPVYYQLRFHQIAGMLENALSDPLEKGHLSSGWKLNSFLIAWECIETCWSKEVYLKPLLHRFWKLTLQVISRLATHLSQLLKDKIPTMDWQNAVELVTAAISDMNTFCSKMTSWFTDVISPSSSGSVIECLRDGLQDSIEQLGLVAKAFQEGGVTIVAQECCKGLENVNAIPRLYRRTNRDVPSKQSVYVDSIVYPLVMLQKKGDLGPEGFPHWCSGVMEIVIQRFLTISGEVLTSVKRTEESLSKLKRSRRSVLSQTIGMSDDNKIRLQIALDIEYLEKKIYTLEYDVSSLTGLKKLKDTAHIARTTALSQQSN